MSRLQNAASTAIARGEKAKIAGPGPKSAKIAARPQLAASQRPSDGLKTSSRQQAGHGSARKAVVDDADETLPMKAKAASGMAACEYLAADTGRRFTVHPALQAPLLLKLSSQEWHWVPTWQQRSQIAIPVRHLRIQPPAWLLPDHHQRSVKPSQRSVRIRPCLVAIVYCPST